MKLNSVNKQLAVLLLVLAPVLYAFFPSYTAIGLAISFVFILNFFLKLEYQLDIRYLIITIAAAQWILGAILSYWFVPRENVYSMVIEAEVYFQFILPTFIFFFVGLFLPISKAKIKKIDTKKKFTLLLNKNNSLDIILILSGLFFSIFNKVAPESLRFITFLLGGIKYVGFLILLLNPKRKNRKLYLVLGAFFLLLTAVLDGSFGTLTYWVILMFIVYAFFIKISNKIKIILTVSAILAVFLMQAVKFEYRDRIWFSSSDYSATEKLKLFRDITELQTQDGLVNEETQQSVISRINQGWIISHIIHHMQLTGEYLEGETINRTVLSIILPGSLYEDKLRAGGQEYFSRFTGRRLGRSTSMNISVIGEAYGNYGSFGAMIFMFIFGFFLNLFWRAVVFIIRKHPLVVFFIPMIFQQAVKAENDLFIVLNHIIKAGIFVFMVYFALSKVYSFKLKRRPNQHILR